MIANNPDMLKSMMLANPHMKKLSEENPEMAAVLNDPSLLKQVLTLKIIQLVS